MALHCSRKALALLWDIKFLHTFFRQVMNLLLSRRGTRLARKRNCSKILRIYSRLNLNSLYVCIYCINISTSTNVLIWLPLWHSRKRYISFMKTIAHLLIRVCTLPLQIHIRISFTGVMVWVWVQLIFNLKSWKCLVPILQKLRFKSEFPKEFR